MANLMEVTIEPGTMQWMVSRNLVRHACGSAIFCRDCKQLLDAPQSVLLTDGARDVVLCATCYGKAPRHLRAGALEVLDGRLLFANPPQAPRKRKSA